MKNKIKCKLWTPVRKGDIYCSPGCGGDCTYEDYLKAQLNAEKLARKLGPRWKPDVWENLGWHCRAISSNGAIKVYPSLGDKTYTAFAGEADFPGGKWAESGSTPKKAVQNVIAKVRYEMFIQEIFGDTDDYSCE